MKLFPYREVKAEDAGEGTFGVKVRWLITKQMGAPNFAMRLFELEPNGHSPLHSHPWEHEVFILEGEGVAVNSNGEHKFKTGDVVFIAPNEQHQFKNTGKKTLNFLCLVPHKK
ncbi:cupin domain-containing protein [Candidatus Bathyarchaeota archaeon]|nr:cupin domain-containing protein [Candidatus Bathyarchaeota archaeon]